MTIRIWHIWVGLLVALEGVILLGGLDTHRYDHMITGPHEGWGTTWLTAGVVAVGWTIMFTINQVQIKKEDKANKRKAWMPGWREGKK